MMTQSKTDMIGAHGAEAPARIQKIMVVDDEILNRKLVEAMLKPQGYEVILAVDGEDCLAKVEENPPT